MQRVRVQVVHAAIHAANCLPPRDDTECPVRLGNRRVLVDEGKAHVPKQPTCTLEKLVVELYTWVGAGVLENESERLYISDLWRAELLEDLQDARSRLVRVPFVAV
jgi:hypothetical protein